MRWWVDIANAPHATLYRPVVSQLRSEGDEVLVTAWDRGQTKALALDAWPDAALVGVAGFRRPILAKASSLWDRSTALGERLRGHGIDVALGHNSYSQLLAARRCQIPAITMMDYEHQPANHLAFRLANLVVTPTAVGYELLRRYGVRRSSLVHYEGYKEEIILSGFQPDPGFRASVGLDADDMVAVVRPAAEGALYHRHRNTLTGEVITRLAGSGLHVLLSPRTAEQARLYEQRDDVTVLANPVSGADLLYWADLVVGAGGTMTREAAVLGTPTWSMFQGKPAAVDAALVREGKLRLLSAASDLPLGGLGSRPERQAWQPPRRALEDLVTLLRDLGERLAGSREKRG